MSSYLFDMSGEVIAFRRSWADPHVFDARGDWIGWFPWDDNNAVDPDGHYLGTVVDDRLVRRNDWYDRPCTAPPPEPDTARPTGRPPTPHNFPNSFAYDDAHLQHLT
ncbi:4-fold beta flower protein [Aeromicrobium sp.]|uniref:4-fold beta flower protein n=1 Tax=Aeromicrobium sp. TaxID=1871063 RepID=UPI001995A415|nr:hypothetical protein [Aeromicrobium sp.]MBC7630104.1 hypothetical protein [Aeromicrobium sp.]